jgi:hypothetical protein
MRNLLGLRLTKPSVASADFSEKILRFHSQTSKASYSQSRSSCKMALSCTAEAGFLKGTPPAPYGFYRARSEF